MNSLPLNIQKTLRRRQEISESLTEEEGRLVIMHHNSRGYKGRFISEGQIPILSLRRILDGCEDYFVAHSRGRWNVVVRTPSKILLFEALKTPPEYATDLANRVSKAYSSKVEVVCGVGEEWRSGYMCLAFLETQLSNLVPRF